MSCGQPGQEAVRVRVVWIRNGQSKRARTANKENGGRSIVDFRLGWFEMDCRVRACFNVGREGRLLEVCKVQVRCSNPGY